MMLFLLDIIVFTHVTKYISLVFSQLSISSNHGDYTSTGINNNQQAIIKLDDYFSPNKAAVVVSLVRPIHVLQTLNMD